MLPNYSWIQFHGAVTHFPLALVMAAAVYELCALLFKKPEFRVVSFWLLIGAAVTAPAALLSGWLGGDELFPRPATPSGMFFLHRLISFLMTGLLLMLVALRIMSKDRLEGRTLMGSLLALFIVSGVAGYSGYLGGEMVFGSKAAPSAPEPAPPAAPATASPAVDVDPKLVAHGKTLYDQFGCQACHRLNGSGATTAPDLTREGLQRPDLQWQIDHLKEPAKLVPGSTMPAYATAKPEELKALAAFMVTRK